MAATGGIFVEFFVFIFKDLDPFVNFPHKPYYATRIISNEAVARDACETNRSNH